MADAPLQPDEFVQIGMCFTRCEIEILAAAFRIESQLHRDGLKQHGFARTVFADEKGHRWMKFEPMQVLNRRDAERIFAEVRHRFPLQPYGIKEGALDFDVGNFGF